MPARPFRARLRSAVHAQDGFGLIEVLVTAVVVIIVATAIFGALDASSNASARTKARSIASTLAQRDQERLRSLDVDDLNNLRQTFTDKSCDSDGSACQTYTIDSRTQWISDTTGKASCTSTDARADYLELVSTVSWQNMRGANPVVMKSIYSPPVGSFGPSQGSLAVKLVGPDGVTPKPGVRVRLSGPRAMSDVTNELGCVVWGFLPAGNGYTLELDEPGHVDPQGVQHVTSATSVVGEALTTRTFLYDRYATANLSFFARIGGTDYAQSVERAVLGHSQMTPATKLLPLTAPAGKVASIATGALFPFREGAGGRYTIYGGNCTAQQPTVGLQTFPDLEPGDRNVPVAVQLPALDTRITVNGAAPTAGNTASYKIIQTTAGCTSAITPTLQPVPTSGPAANVGRLMQMGLPVGTYTVCAQAKVGSTTYREAYKLVVPSIAGTKVPSTTGVIDIQSTGTPSTGRDDIKDCNAAI